MPEDEDAAALLRTHLADRRVLLVLGNAFSIDQVRPLLPGAAGCAVLVTSRGRLGALVAGSARIGCFSVLSHPRRRTG